MPRDPEPRFARLLLALAVLLALFSPARAFNIGKERWIAGEVPMHLQLGPSGGPLLDGAANWGVVAESALALWNSSLTNVRFTVVRDSTAPIARSNNTNNVFWSYSVYGDTWDSRTMSRASPTLRSTSAFGVLSICSPKAMFCATVMCGKSA